MIRRKVNVTAEDDAPEDIKKMLSDFIRGFWLFMKVLLVVIILSPIFISTQAKSYLAKGMTYVVDVDTICEPYLCQCHGETPKVEKKDVKKEVYKGNGSI